MLFPKQDECINKIIEFLPQNTTKYIFLIGSFAKNENNENSDIDLLVVSDAFKTINGYLRQKICYEDYFQFYMGFYYLPQKVFDKEAEELSNGIFQANINISCFRCLIHASDMINISLDTSTNTYFLLKGTR